MTKKRIQNRRTPSWLFELLNKNFGPFTLDVAADDENHLCEKYYTEEMNGLDLPWSGTVFCNPPFVDMGRWVSKAHYEVKRRGVTSMLIAPGVGSQDWFHDIASKYTIYMPDKRISFLSPDGTWATDAKGKKTGADRDTSILVMGPEYLNDLDYGYRILSYGVGEAMKS